VEKLDGATQVARLMPANPSFEIAASPSRWEVVWTYVMLGVEHILLGVDHLLFVLGLLLIVQGRMLLLKTITAFTVAHSIAKSFRVLDMQWPVWALRAPGYVVGTCGAYWTIQRTVMLFGE
jgi:hypothetical protein